MQLFSQGTAWDLQGLLYVPDPQVRSVAQHRLLSEANTCVLAIVDPVGTSHNNCSLPQDGTLHPVHTLGNHGV